MAIESTDIDYKLSGGGANADADLSLGGAISSVDMPLDIFDDVSSAEATAGLVEYRCIYVKNAHGSETLQGPKIWFEANTPSATTTIELVLGTSAEGGTEQAPGGETSAPSGIGSWAAPTNFATGVALGDIPAGGHRAVWLRRTVNAGTALASDTFTLRTQGDTNP